MRILYLHLQNFAGIFAGTQKTSITIDFNKDYQGNPIKHNNIIMLFGENGSGKSTILSTLHPFMDTGNDNRKNPIMKDKEGYKEIHYKKDHTYYIIRHFYKKQNKSYITKCTLDEYNFYMDNKDTDDKVLSTLGEELNENGGVRSFKEIVEEELDINEEFFKLSRIGSNVTNFIDLTTAKRKEFISMFLPDIEEYLEAYKRVNTKHREMNKSIKYIVEEMQKLDSEENIETDLANTKNIINQTKQEIQKLNNTITETETKINILNPDNKYHRYRNPYREEYTIKERDLNKATINYDKLYKVVDTNNLTSYKSSDIQTDIKLLEGELKNLADKIDAKKQELSNLYPEIQSKEKIINSNKDDDKTVNKNYKEVTDKIKNITSMIQATKNNLISDYETVDQSTCFKITQAGENMLQGMEELYKSMETINTSLMNLLHEKSQLSPEVLKTILNQDKQKLKTLQDQKEEMQNKKNLYVNNLDQLEILKKRPDDCNIDECPFIKNALQFKDVDKLLVDVKQSLETLEEQEKKLEYRIENLEELYKIYVDLSNIYDNNIEFIKLTTIKLSKDNYYSLLVDKNISEVRDLFNMKYVNDHKQYLELLKVEKDKLERLETLREQFRKNKKIITTIQEELDNIYKLRETLKLDSENLYNEYQNKLKAKEKREKIIKILDSYEQMQEIKDIATKDYEDIKKAYEVAEEEISQIKELEKIKQEALGSLKKYTEILTTTEDQYDKIYYKLNRLKEYKARKLQLDDQFETLSIFKDTLDPKKGIPVYFIDNYLNKTREISNELLDISQKGKFAIDFEVDSKDFFINVYKNNGDILEDISLASQGETSITSLSLSLALIEQSMSKHNILYLDELDGALDADNRRGFIEMVENQMEKLDIEQVFIISHNNEFDYYPIDLILLKDAQFDIDNEELMANKNLLFKY